MISLFWFFFEVKLRKFAFIFMNCWLTGQDFKIHYVYSGLELNSYLQTDVKWDLYIHLNFGHLLWVSSEDLQKEKFRAGVSDEDQYWSDLMAKLD